MSTQELARPKAQIHLAGFFGFAPAYVWSESERNDIYYDFDTFAQLAQTAERGLFTTLFLGDSLRLREHLGKINDTSVTGRPDQLVLFSYLAALTSHIGLVATLNTTYTDPADLARRLATVDVLSNGRAGWNIVTTDNAWTGENFRKGGYLPRSERYLHAAEHMAIVQGLWAGWQPGDVSMRAEAPTWSEPGSGAAVVHQGSYYDVTAAPSVPPSPQGQPVLFQAGESDEGRDFAIRYAQAIFSRYTEFGPALEFAQDMRRRLVEAGRPEDDLKIFPATRIILGDTDAEARDKARWFHESTWSERRILGTLESVWGHDLSYCDVDGPLPETDPVVDTQTRTHGVVNSRDQPSQTAASWRALAKARGFSIRQFVAHLNAAFEFVGSPTTVADELARYAHAGAVDGLNVSPASVPHGFDEIVDRLVPELQDRGVYPTEYAGTTLRANLGLRPALVAESRRARSLDHSMR